MSWTSEVLGILEFHEERQRIHGTPINGNKKNGWSLRDTASHFSISVWTASYAIRLAKELKKDPNRFSGLTKHDAIKLLDESTMVEVKNSKLLLTGKLVKKVDVNGHDFFIVKPDKEIETKFINIEYLLVPSYCCRFIK